MLSVIKLMRSIKSLYLLILLIFITIVFSGCRDLLTKHDINMDGVQHGEKLYRAGGAENCTACHGVTLEGNDPFIPGCYSCHEALWDNNDHTVNRGGVNHLQNVNAKSDCGPCHGGNALEGSRNRPSCYECHGNVWNASEIHTVELNDVFHAPEYFDPATNCTQCHGDDFLGMGSAPSCYQCHNAKWERPATHTVNKNWAVHDPNLFTPIGICDECHGTNLQGVSDGGTAQSCYTCHVNLWDRPSSHTTNKGGAMHDPGLFSPDVNCSSSDCHGTDLKGGTTGGATARSCYTCHGSAWLDPPATHTKNKDGYLHDPRYKPSRGGPYGICNVAGCHGTDALVAPAGFCHTCHGDEWTGE